MTIISQQQLDDHCKNIVDTSGRYYDNLGDFFTVLYNTCRWVEVYELSRWGTEDLETYFCQTAKGGNVRSINAASLPSNFLFLISTALSTWDVCRYNSMRKYSARFALFPSLYCLDKQIELHCFRHNHIKYLYSLGNSYEQIATYMGEVDPDNIKGYVESIIYYNE